MPLPSCLTVDPVEFVYKSTNGELVLLVEVKLTLEGENFGKYMAQICHQLFAMALFNHSKSHHGPVRGFLTDGMRWIEVEFALSDKLPKAVKVPNSLKGSFKYSTPEVLFNREGEHGLTINSGFRRVVSRVANILIPDVVKDAKCDIKGMLDAYDLKLQQLVSTLLAGGGTRTNVPDAERAAKRRRTTSAAASSGHLAEAKTALGVLITVKNPKQQEAAYAALQGAVGALSIVSLDVGVATDVVDAVQKALDDVEPMPEQKLDTTTCKAFMTKLETLTCALVAEDGR